jgi:hypothetical protein
MATPPIVYARPNSKMNTHPVLTADATAFIAIAIPTKNKPHTKDRIGKINLFLPVNTPSIKSPPFRYHTIASRRSKSILLADFSSPNCRVFFPLRNTSYNF